MGPMGLMRLRFQLPGCFSTLYRLRRVCTAHEQVLQEGDSSHGGQGESRGDRFSELVRYQILQVGLRSLKGDIEKLRENIKNRASTANVDKLAQLYGEYRQLMYQVQQLRRERNINTQQFTSLKTKEERDQLAHRGAELKQTMSELEGQKDAKAIEMIPELSLLPNTTHPDVCVGGYDKARVVYTHGTKPDFTFPVKEHVEIGEHLGLFDFSSAAEISGQRFYYLKGAAAMLELALIQFAMQKAVAKGYQPIITPDIVKADLVEGCGFHPRGVSTQVYTMGPPHGNLCLSGTAEIPLAGMFTDRIIPMNQFPIRLVAFGRCYRAETGGAGHALRGLYRVHQFSKVELFGLTTNEDGKESSNLLEEIVELQKDILNDLGLHYRVLDMPTEELGASAYRKFDIEVWMPGREDYGEVTSASNCTDFQSQRVRITYHRVHQGRAGKKLGNTGKKYAHTVNGTACAIPRIIVSLLENYQQEDGSVILPKVLRPFIAPQYWHIKPS